VVAAPKKSRTGLALLVVGLVAIVVGGGVMMYLRSQDQKPGPTPKEVPTETATTAAPTTTATATATASATAAATTDTTAEPSASAATSAEVPPSGDTPKDPKSLAPSLGYLIVTASQEVDVFSNGKKVGVTNSAIEIGCVPPQKFITVGQQTAAGTKFLTKGKRAVVACQDVSRIEFTDAEFAAGPGALPPPGGQPPPPGGAPTGAPPGGAPTGEPYEPQAP
jgi:hypothetical protein